MWIWMREHALPIFLGALITLFMWTGSTVIRLQYTALTDIDEQRIVRLVRDEVRVINSRIDQVVEIVLQIQTAQLDHSSCEEKSPEST